ncbi:NAD(P)/FAD-dependent oxidoreductase [Kutzneria buriramensis]|uniref:2-polyprenyl-6-methoxyphenol hydroxylase-like FAD-dependent oxidoreductase n=1 Tax=Kutzneria buriramensis TaxID=1045776 RepID=A0A3E0IAI6_9PSEU|nr:FAD-dependent monooxygenase [Kutzneria buriramensis]REH55155.1 2-polyprenyl-6-methoxyphenol hydroxylase-like FAD-dependent oxidoreductase [Kutzneria buriramensis]
MKALIIGAGITGPVAALALRKAGIEAEIYEAYEQPADDVGGWLMIAPNGVAALGLLGLDTDLRTIGRPNRRMVMLDGRGKRFGAMDELDEDNPSQLVLRPDLYRLLVERADAAGIKIHRGKRLVAAEETANGVTVRFADGSTAEGDVLIGADGVHSTVRTLIDPDAPGPRYTGLLGFAGYLPGNDFGLDRDEFYFAQGKGGFLGYALTAEGDTGWFTNVPSAEPITGAQARAIGAEEWLRRMRELYGDDYPAHDMLARSTADEMVVVGGMHIMPSAPRWHSDRMVLVGDAAHVPSNSTGQGASMSIESAIELARCLRDLPARQAFEAYERLRRERVEKVAEYGEKVNQDKVNGRVSQLVTSVLAPIAMKLFMKPEKMFGWLHRFRIDWDAKVTAD